MKWVAESDEYSDFYRSVWWLIGKMNKHATLPSIYVCSSNDIDCQNSFIDRAMSAVARKSFTKRLMKIATGEEYWKLEKVQIVI